MYKIVSTTLLLATLLLSGCTTTEESIAPTVIYGRITNHESVFLHQAFVFPMEFEGEARGIELELRSDSDTSSTFHFSTTMTHRHNMMIQYSGQSFYVMASPGDSISIAIDARSGGLRFEGDNARFNNQLDAVQHAMFQRYVSLPAFDFEVSPQQFLQQISQQIEMMSDTLAHLATLTELDDDVREFLLDDIRYTLSEFIIGYDSDDIGSAHRKSMFESEIFQLDDASNWHTYTIYTHTINYMRELLFADAQLRELLIDPDADIKHRTKLALELVLRLDKSPKRDIMLNHIITHTPLIMGEDIYDPRYLEPSLYHNPAFLELYIRPFFNRPPAVIENDYTDEIGIKSRLRYMNGESTRSNSIGRRDVMHYIGEQYRGRVIYLGTWSTSNSSSIDEARSVDLLRSNFDQRDVAFVTLCFESSVGDWESAIKKGSLRGDHYLVEDLDVVESLHSQLKVSGYPTYILIDREGQIAASSIFRPSQTKQATKLINRYL